MTASKLSRSATSSARRPPRLAKSTRLLASPSSPSSSGAQAASTLLFQRIGDHVRSREKEAGPLINQEIDANRRSLPFEHQKRAEMGFVQLIETSRLRGPVEATLASGHSNRATLNTQKAEAKPTERGHSDRSINQRHRHNSHSSNVQALPRCRSRPRSLFSERNLHEKSAPRPWRLGNRWRQRDKEQHKYQTKASAAHWLLPSMA